MEMEKVMSREEMLKRTSCVLLIGVAMKVSAKTRFEVKSHLAAESCGGTSLRGSI